MTFRRLRRGSRPRFPFNPSPKRLRRGGGKRPAEGEELALPPSLLAAALRPFQARVGVGVGKDSKREGHLSNDPSEQGGRFPQMPRSEESAPRWRSAVGCQMKQRPAICEFQIENEQFFAYKCGKPR